MIKIFRLSVISGISELSGAEWKPTAGPFAWVQNQMMRGTDPRDLLKDMISADSVIPGRFIYRLENRYRRHILIQYLRRIFTMTNI